MQYMLLKNGILNYINCKLYNIGKNTFCQSKYLSVHHSLIQTRQNKGVEFQLKNIEHNKL